MEKVELDELLKALQRRADHLERRQRQLIAGLVLIVAVLVSAAWQSRMDPQENNGAECQLVGQSKFSAVTSIA